MGELGHIAAGVLLELGIASESGKPGAHAPKENSQPRALEQAAQWNNDNRELDAVGGG
jgi:hypothetical protein